MKYIKPILLASVTPSLHFKYRNTSVVLEPLIFYLLKGNAIIEESSANVKIDTFCNVRHSIKHNTEKCLSFIFKCMILCWVKMYDNQSLLWWDNKNRLNKHNILEQVQIADIIKLNTAMNGVKISNADSCPWIANMCTLFNNNLVSVFELVSWLWGFSHHYESQSICISAEFFLWANPKAWQEKKKNVCAN